MMAFSYVVRCAFEERAPMESFLAWLCETHVNDVCRAGACRAEIVLVDGTLAIDIRYEFDSREDFVRYEREDAPRLRQDGLDAAARAGVRPGAGIAMTRTTGEIVHRAPPLTDQAAARAR